MSLSILNNIPSLAAQNQLASTQTNLQKTLFELASGSRLNSGADDAAGLSIADSLNANVMALNQSQQNDQHGSKRADLRVSWKHTDEKRRDCHRQNREHQCSFTAMMVADIAEPERAERTHQKPRRKDPERCYQFGRFAF